MHGTININYDTSVTPPKPFLHTARYSASSFNLRCLFISLTSSSSCLCPLTRLPSPFMFTALMCFGMQFLCKKWEREKRPRVVLLYVGYSFPPWLSVMASQFSHDRSNVCPSFFSSITLQNFPDTLDLLSEVFKFQYHISLYCSLTNKCTFFLNFEKFKIYIKIHINIALTCFGLQPSSGRLFRAWLKLYFI